MQPHRPPQPRGPFRSKNSVQPPRKNQTSPRAYIKQPRARGGPTNGRPWLRQLPTDDSLQRGLLSLSERARGVGTVLTDAEIKVQLPAPTIKALQQNFRSVETVVLPMRALILSDGLLLACGEQGSAGDGFEGNVVFTVRRCPRVGRAFGKLFLSSGVIRVPAHKSSGCNCSRRLCTQSTAEAILCSIYPRWQTVQVRIAREPPALELAVSTARDAAAEVFPIPEATLASLVRQLEQRSGVADAELASANAELAGVKATIVRRGENTLLTLRIPGREDKAVFGVHRHMFGVVTEYKQNGVYVHGARALLAHVLKACRVLPKVYDIPPLHADLLESDNLVQVIRSMALETSYEADAERVKLFKILGITSRAGLREPGGNVSVYPLARAVQLEQLCPPQVVHALNLHGVDTREIHTAVNGAYAIFSKYYLFKSKTPKKPALLDAQQNCRDATGDAHRTWLQEIMQEEHSHPLPAATLSWYGQDVSVKIIPHGRGGGIIFSDDGGAFAVAGVPVLFARDSFHPHTQAAEAWAEGRSLDVGTPAPDALKAVQGNSPRGAAVRLAHLDLLSTTFPQFAAHADLLRRVWLHSEKQRLIRAGFKDDAYCIQMGVLAQLSRLPPGVHYWATVPYMAAEEYSLNSDFTCLR